MTAPGLRERQRLSRMTRISAAANALFTSRGFHDVTTGEVAAAADVGIATLYRYAPSKGELLLMVVVDRFTGIDAAEHDTGDPVADLLGVFADMVAAIRRRPDNAMVFYQELVFGPPGPNRDRALALVDDLHRAIAVVLDRHPRLPGASDTADLARTLANACFMEVLRAGMSPGSLDDLTTALERRIRTVLRGHLDHHTETRS